MSNGSSPNSPPSSPPDTASPSTLPPKFADPCKAFSELTERRQQLVAGGALAEFEYHGNGTMRRQKYNIANLEALDRDIREAQAECAKVVGAPNPNRRFALTAGDKGCGLPGMRWSARTGYY